MAIKKLTNKTEYNYSKMRWKDKDYQNLHKAYNEFVNEVKKHESSLPAKAVPRIPTYKELKSNITSRKDYELTMSILKDIKNENAFDLLESKANPNVKFTKWEYQKAQRYDYRNQVKTQIEYNKVIDSIKNKETKVEKDVYGNPVRDSEGNIVARAIFSDTYKRKLEQQLQETNVEMINKAQDYYRLRELFERTERRGSDTFEFKKAETYKENFLKSIDDWKNLDNYDEVVKKIEKLDSKKFFEFMKDNEEAYNNLWDYYDNRMTQTQFNEFARKLGVKIDDSIEQVTENIF